MKLQNSSRNIIRVYICFYGITRSLNYTLPSIRKYIFDDLSSFSDLSIHCHFFKLQSLNNPRTGEVGPMDSEVAKELFPEVLRYDPPIEFETTEIYKEISKFGDSTGDNFKSLRNLLHQLRSLKEVISELDLATNDIVVFARPDMVYHDSFKDTVLKALSEREPTVFLPGWQSWLGLNDRFAVCVGANAVKSYANRGQYALEFCRSLNTPLNAEGLLDYTLSKDGIKVRHMGVRASRMRTNGTIKYEDFTYWTGRNFISNLAWNLRRRCLRSKGFAVLRKLKDQVF